MALPTTGDPFDASTPARACLLSQKDEGNPIRATNNSIMTSFNDLGLSEKILQAVADKGYKTPSPIQAQAIPAVLAGRDMIAAAQTGTGKTAGFTLPMVELLTQNKPRRQGAIRALVLTPTRELAAQVQDSIKTYGKHLPLTSMVVFGGVNIKPQISQLRRGVDILVATPGRLMDLCQQGACKLDQVEMLILDEADRMLDMGFINDIRKVVKLLPQQRQNLMFSATFSKEIRQITREFLNDPLTIEVARENTAAETVAQRAYRCDAAAKTDLAIKLIKDGEWSQVLVFTRTKHGANRLSEKLCRAGVNSSAIHGNKSQGARTRALAGFKDGSVRVLVATDIAARGIDIAQLPHVINFELPNVSEDYVHRIGRTGRAGMEGEAISLVCNDERPFFKGIEKLINQHIPLTDVDGFEPKLWPDRAPTGAEVMKATEARKQANRQNRGPRQPRETNYGGGGGAKSGSRSSSRPRRAARGR